MRQLAKQEKEDSLITNRYLEENKTFPLQSQSILQARKKTFHNLIGRHESNCVCWFGEHSKGLLSEMGNVIMMPMK